MIRRLTGSGRVAALGGAGLVGAGLALGYPTLTSVGLAAAVAVLAALAAVQIRPGVSVSRTVTPGRVTVGEPALVRLDVHNLKRWRAPRFDAVEHLDGAPVGVRVAALAGHQRRALYVPVPTGRRGLVRVGPVVVERSDPLGLARRAQPLSDRAWLWIHPRVHPVPALPLGVVLDFEGDLAERATAGSTAFASLRDYRAGDEPRHIHWRSSARLGTLLVREHVDTTEPTTTILVDTRRDALDGDRLEAAVEFAASVAVASGRAGQEVRLLAPAEDVARVREAGGHHVLDRLAALRASDPAGDAEVVRLAEQARPGGCLVVLSGGEPGLVAALARLRRRFARVVIVQVLPAVAGRAGGPPATIRRAGLAVIRAGTVGELVRAWARLAGGRTG
jgi:uncharacterized protein (DUF58 family)